MSTRTPREIASDPTTAPDMLARLVTDFPAEVAANPSTPIHTLIERVLVRHHLPIVYANPIWPLLALESPKDWVEKYRATLDGVWLELGKSRLSWSQKLLLCVKFAEHGLSLVDAEHLSDAREAIESVRELASNGSGPREFNAFLRESASMQRRLGKGSGASTEAAKAIFYAGEFVECADSVRYGMAWKYPNSVNEILDELHWQANQIRAALGYAPPGETVGGVRDNPEDEPPYEQYEQDDIRTLAEGDLLAALAHPNIHKDTMVGLLSGEVESEYERLRDNQGAEAAMIFYEGVFNAVTKNPALDLFWLDLPPDELDPLLHRIWSDWADAVRGVLISWLEEMGRDELIDWFLPLVAHDVSVSGFTELDSLLQMAGEIRGRSDLPSRADITNQLNKFHAKKKGRGEIYAQLAVVISNLFTIVLTSNDDFAWIVQEDIGWMLQDEASFWARRQGGRNGWLYWKLVCERYLTLLAQLEA